MKLVNCFSHFLVLGSMGGLEAPKGGMWCADIKKKSLAQDNLICAPSRTCIPDGPSALGLSALSLHTVALAAWDTFFPCS